MSAREPMSEALVQRMLIGVTPGEWRVAGTAYSKGRHIVAESGVIIGGIRKEEDAQLASRSADVAEWGLRMARRVAELERQLDQVTATDDDEFTDEHRRAIGDVSKEH